MRCSSTFANFDHVSYAKAVKLLQAIKENKDCTLSFCKNRERCEISTSCGMTTFLTLKVGSEKDFATFNTEVSIPNSDALPLIEEMMNTVTSWGAEDM